MFCFAWLLNLGYVSILLLGSPVIIYRMLRFGKYRHGLAEKLFGWLPRTESDTPLVWFHAVSVGEVLQLEPVLAQLAEREPARRFLVTTTTSTGRDVARTKFPESTIAYFPFDFSWAVRRALRRVQPDAIVLVELELWPNFILEASRQCIPLALINGRMSDRSFRGYGRIRPLISALLRRLDCVAVQTQTYAERFRRLGAATARVHTTGSIKFDRLETDPGNPRTVELRRSFHIADNERVFIAGSTQAPEEAIAVAAWCSIREQFPDVRLILVPRHRERFEEVANLVMRHGLPLLLRTDTSHRRRAADGQCKPVLVLDTLGELSACWGLADVAFVGGSLVEKRGGQNMLEPAAYGAAVLFGPYTDNFRDIVELLLAEDAAQVVHTAQDLSEQLSRLFGSATSIRRLGCAAQRVIASQQGAVPITCELIERVAGRTSAERAAA